MSAAEAVFSTELEAGPWTPFPQVLPAGGVGGFRAAEHSARGTLSWEYAPQPDPSGGCTPGLGTAIATAPPARGAVRGSCERRSWARGPTIVESRLALTEEFSERR